MRVRTADRCIVLIGHRRPGRCSRWPLLIITGAHACVQMNVPLGFTASASLPSGERRSSAGLKIAIPLGKETLCDGEANATSRSGHDRNAISAVVAQLALRGAFCISQKILTRFLAAALRSALRSRLGSCGRRLGRRVVFLAVISDHAFHRADGEDRAFPAANRKRNRADRHVKFPRRAAAGRIPRNGRRRKPPQTAPGLCSTGARHPERTLLRAARHVVRRVYCGRLEDTRIHCRQATA